MTDRIKLVLGLVLTYAIAAVERGRDALSALADHPWFPNRKVIAFAVAGAVTHYATLYLGLNTNVVLIEGVDTQLLIDSGVGALVAWLIPERLSVKERYTDEVLSDDPYYDPDDF